MATKTRIKTCRWPRFARYEFVNDRIVPAAGSKIHWYDPWRDYTAAKTDTGGQPPYVGLLTLVDRLSIECRKLNWDWTIDPDPPRISSEARALVLDWSMEYGPLGVFHQTTTQADDLAGDLTWTRSGGRWYRHQRFRRLLHPPTYLMQIAPTDPHQHQLDSSEILPVFFCGTPPSEMPAPDSEEFFSAYSEPLFHWVRYAFAAAEAISARDGDALNVLAGAAGRERHLTRDGVTTEIVFPSLLSAYGEMVWQDLEAGNRIAACGYCGQRFITDRDWTKFCSRDCATKERQRRFLERNPDYYRVQPKKGRKAK